MQMLETEQELYRVPIDRNAIEFDRSDNKFYLNLDEDSLMSLYFEIKGDVSLCMTNFGPFINSLW